MCIKFGITALLGYIFIAFLAFIGSPIYGKQDMWFAHEDLILSQNSTEFKLAISLIRTHNDIRSADSIMYQSFLAGITMQNQSKICEIIDEYFNLPEIYTTNSSNLSKVITYAENLVKQDISINDKLKINKALFQIYYRLKGGTQCQLFASHFNSLVERSTSSELLAYSNLLYGRSWNLNKNITEAHKYLFEALYHAENSSNPVLIYLVNNEISDFYFQLNLNQKSLHFNNKILSIIKLNSHFDSLLLNHKKLENLNLIRILNQGDFEINAFKEIVHFSTINKYKRLYSFCMAFLRTSLIENNRSSQLIEILESDFPSELNRLINEEPLDFFRIKAYSFNANGKMDSAKHYFTKCLQLIEKNILPEGYKARFYLFYGTYLLKLNDYQQAEKYLVISLKHAENSSINNFTLQTLLALDSLYTTQNLYEKAYQIKERYNEIKIAMNEIAHTEDMYRIESEYLEKIMVDRKQKNEDFKNHMFQTQYDLIAIFIVLIFIGLMLMVQYKMPVWLIRSLGFLSFIFLFEFLIIKLDKQIHEITHEVPWKLFSIKVIMIAILLPLHHYVEKKAIHYLVHKRSEAGGLFQLNFISRFRNWFQKLNSDNDTN